MSELIEGLAASRTPAGDALLAGRELARKRTVHLYSWASNSTAKSIHAQLLWLTHTLLLLLETAVVEAARIRNGAEDARRERRLAQVQANLAEAGEWLPDAVRALLRCTQHSVKLIRWLRSSLRESTSCRTALARLRKLYAKL